MKEVSVILPTYNEAENLPKLIPLIDEALSDYSHEVVVVDDDSPDRTWEVAEDLADDYPVGVIRRTEERGLATAVVRGIKETDSEIVAVMDADLQHPPEKLSELVGKVKNGAEVAIGSRFVEGGEIRGWSLKRKFISKLGKLMPKTLFPSVRKIKDPMSGFFAVKRGILDIEKLQPRGFKILLEILVICEPERVEEVPITFQDRRKGESSMGFEVYKDYILHNLSLFKRSGELGRFLRFASVGISGILVDMLILFSLVEFLKVPKIISKIFSTQGAILSNFTWNRLWTFKDKEKDGLLRNLGKFEVASLGGKLTNIFIFSLLTWFFSFYYLFNNLIAIILACIVNYLSYNHWVWFEK